MWCKDNVKLLSGHQQHHHQTKTQFFYRLDALLRAQPIPKYSTECRNRYSRCEGTEAANNCYEVTTVWCYINSVITGRMPRSGKLPVLFLLTGQKSGLSPRRGDSLHRFGSNFAGPTGTWVCLAVQNFTSNGAEGWECGPQNIKNFHFLVKRRPAGATPLTDFENF